MRRGVATVVNPPTRLVRWLSQDTPVFTLQRVLVRIVALGRDDEMVGKLVGGVEFVAAPGTDGWSIV